MRRRTRSCRGRRARRSWSPVQDVDRPSQSRFRALHDRLRERGVRMDREGEVLDGRAHLDRKGELADDVTRVRTYDDPAKKAVRLGVRNELHETVRLPSG